VLHYVVISATKDTELDMKHHQVGIT